MSIGKEGKERFDMNKTFDYFLIPRLPAGFPIGRQASVYGSRKNFPLERKSWS